MSGFVTRQETTWGDLRHGERIVDKADENWVLGKPGPVGSDIRVTITSQDRTVVVVKPATDKVTVLRAQEPEKHPDPEVQAETDRVQDVFGEDTKVELLATETDEEQAAREAATDDDPLRLPAIEDPLSLRGHLYLLHKFLVHEATNGAALREHHRRSHQLEAEGRGQEGYAPHIHEEEK